MSEEEKQKLKRTWEKSNLHCVSRRITLATWRNNRPNKDLRKIEKNKMVSSL